MKIDSPSITGSLTAQNGLTGSLLGTASWAESASQALTSSYINPQFISASAAASGFGSGGSVFPFTGSAIITGSLIVTGSTTSTLGFTGSLFGTSSWANNSLTASYVDTLNQDVTITGTLTVGGEVSGIQGQVTAIATRNYLFSGF